MFIMRGLSTATRDTILSADDGDASAVQADGYRFKRFVVRQRLCSIQVTINILQQTTSPEAT
jgi:hypothetical protein